MSYEKNLKTNIDWKRKTMHVYLNDINGTSIKVLIDEEGNCELESDWFKTIEVNNKLQAFIDALKEHLSKDQLESILCLWGTSNAIKASNMTEVLQDKLLTKKIIGLGLLKKVITGGVNSTYKVIDKAEQKTMAEIATKMAKGDKVDESLVEIAARLKREGKIGQVEEVEEVVEEIEEVVGEIEEVVEEEQKSMTRYVRPAVEKVTAKKAVSIIAEKKDYGTMSELNLREELTVLQHELEMDKWAEDRTPWHVHDEIKLIKAQLNGFENRKNAEKYKQEVNNLSPKSMVRRPETQDNTKGSQILPKKKPLVSSTSVVKKRS